MADENNNNASPPNRTRRSSFAGETLANLFGTGHRGSVSRNPTDSNNGNMNPSQPSQSYPGPITTAAAQAQRRRLSLTTLGLSGSPNGSSPFGSYSARRDSYGSRDSIDESAIEDDAGPAEPTPQTPFARRVSFGAKALRDVKAGGGNTSPGQNGSSEGFNWSENFRTRAERTSSIAGGVGMPAMPNGSGRAAHGRAQSVAVMEPPAREMPKPKEQVRPDHFQERILKGDFYMD